MKKVLTYLLACFLVPMSFTSIGQNYEEISFKKQLEEAKNGDSDAQFHVCYYYSKGVGVSKNLKKAFYWNKKAAEQGSANSQYTLGMCYTYGYKCEKNLYKAAVWVKKAYDNGVEEASKLWEKNKLWKYSDK